MHTTCYKLFMWPEAYLQSTMGQERMNGIASKAAWFHYDLEIDYDAA